ncbi:MAG TPA: hypothetical protein VKA70_06855 [Blastocatellia bacterium]|nr:hypothetical protein [Blastocatellia bacterium]
MKGEEKPKRWARVNVKLVPGINPSQADKILSEMPGVNKVIQLFPDEPDEELLGMYMLEIDPDQLDAAMKKLSKDPKLESAEATARRKLIR